MQSACSSGRRIRTFVASFRNSRPTVRRSLIMLRGPGRTRTPIASRLRLKVGCITFLPRARRAADGRAFELLRHRLFSSWERSESNRVGASTRGLQPRPEPCRSTLPWPENEKTAEGVSQGGSSVVGYLLAWSTSLEPSLHRCGSRAAADAWRLRLSLDRQN